MSIKIFTQKTRNFTLVGTNCHLSSCSGVNGGFPTQTQLPYNMNFVSHDSGCGAYQLNLGQAEELAKSIDIMFETNLAKNINVTLDNQVISDVEIKVALLQSLQLAEYKVETTYTVAQLSPRGINRIKDEVAAQAKLAQSINTLSRNVQSFSLSTCKKAQELLKTLA